MKTRNQILSSRKFISELTKLKSEIEEMKKIRDYTEWVEKTNLKLAEINRRIRSLK